MKEVTREQLNIALARAPKMIETSEEKHKPCLARYLSLMNLQIHHTKAVATSQVGSMWAMIFKSMSIKRLYEEKFGDFEPAETAVADTDREDT